MSTFVVLLIIGLGIPAAVAVRILRERRNRALPPGNDISGLALEAVLAHVPDAQTPTWDARMAAVGIPLAIAFPRVGNSYQLRVEADAASGRDVWCPFAHDGSGWVGRMFAARVEVLRTCRMTVPASAYCERCDDVMDMALFETVRVRYSIDAPHTSRAVPGCLGRWCSRCGDVQEGRVPASEALGELWRVHGGNIRRLVEAMEAPGARRTLGEAELGRVESEIEDIERRRDYLRMERRRLQDGLGLLSGDPHR